jgi:hypothetical protein
MQQAQTGGMQQAQTESQSGKFHSRKCFIDQAFVNHLHLCCRKDSNKQPAVQSIVQQPQRFKLFLAQMDFLDYHSIRKL